MQWISEQSFFRDILSTGKHFVQADERSEGSGLRRLVFDASELCTKAFFGLLQNLMRWSGDSSCYYVVIDPDPINYYWLNFQKYPSVEVSVDDHNRDYLSVLDEDPGGSPADAIGINWDDYVIFPRSKKWFIRGRRDDVANQGGHIWIPPEWRDKITKLYPYLSL